MSQSLHKAELLEQTYKKLKQTVDEAIKTKQFSQKQLNREIVDLTEVINFSIKRVILQSL